MSVKENNLYPALVTASEFAKEKNVTQVAVSQHIADNKLEVVLVGKSQKVFIDSVKYKDYQFSK